MAKAPYSIERISETWEKRLVANGFVQHREIYPDGRRGPWQFHVAIFDATVSGQMGTCTVSKENGYEKVPIDPQDRVRINGRWYGRLHWDH
jgi:hypothetical protein